MGRLKLASYSPSLLTQIIVFLPPAGVILLLLSIILDSEVLRIAGLAILLAVAIYIAYAIIAPLFLLATGLSARLRPKSSGMRMATALGVQAATAYLSLMITAFAGLGSWWFIVWLTNTFLLANLAGEAYMHAATTGRDMGVAAALLGVGIYSLYVIVLVERLA